MKTLWIICFSILIFSTNSQQNNLRFLEETLIDGCWLKSESYGRGVGEIPDSCKEGFEKNGLLCYPVCENGYSGVGPVCWENCPSDFRNDGAFCFKPQAYGRGVGYISIEKCNQENSQGCELNGLLYYPKCSEGFYNVGCCICSPVCPSKMTDIGVSCAKNSYGRGAGTLMECAKNKEKDRGLCYTSCENGYNGVGPVCWAKCPDGFNKCGPLCVKGRTCTEQLKHFIEGAANIFDEFNQKKILIGIRDSLGLVSDLIYEPCS